MSDKFEIVSGYESNDEIAHTRKCPCCDYTNSIYGERSLYEDKPYACKRCGVVLLNGEEISDSWTVKSPKSCKMKLFCSTARGNAALKPWDVVDVFVLARNVEEADDKASKRYGVVWNTRPVFDSFHSYIEGEFIF